MTNSTSDGEKTALMDADVSKNADRDQQHDNNGDWKLIDESKINIPKEDLIRHLAELKSELQSKEVALASFKLEQLKRLINPVEISRSSLANTYIELQDRLKARDCQKNGNNNQRISPGASTTEHNQRTSETTSSETNGKQVSVSEDFDDDHESLNLLGTLLELLDRHPMLALPRDSIYCLDYNCNELSTKNYLNLKIQHLENLIDQHRRFRYYMIERLKRSEQRYIDLTMKLEMEKNLRIERERSLYRVAGKDILLKHINQLKEELENEKESKREIVMTLLNELLDERERNEILTNKLTDLEGTPTSDRKPSLACKPRVPAKPAQLLDKQRSQTKKT